jgi:hypothetical protein
MEKFLKLQPSPRVDNIVDGHEMTQLPYPFFVEQDGTVLHPDTVQAVRALGFQTDLARHEVDLLWDEIWEHPELAVGKYLVSTTPDGGMGVHTIAIDTAEFIGG